MDFQPAYISALRRSRLRAAADQGLAALSACTLCPRRCGVDRTAGETGYCHTADQAVVASYNAHFGEEAPLVGRKGSGTIFFAHCNLLCNFCQNYEISHGGEGWPVSARQLADIMLELQAMGCHNINFVTPSHVVPQILAALIPAAEQGLNIPLVFNSGGYDSAETLRLLDGIVDIYMPDFKFMDAAVAEQTCQAPDYPVVVQAAVAEMHRQVGDLKIADSGLAQRGLLVRHLVLPDGLAGTRQVMRFLATRISADTYVNIMPQYRPCGRAREMPALSRTPTVEEFEQALREAQEEGITRLDQRRRSFVLW
ncbi:radical SAM protein [Desulfatitalea alkaliphila]|uniref:Radical SAM protein n=1 Tax=Desulfatitalea alkaliphila TaxID=2929485 RepID=A0AA41R6U5_9BACT|nr:radical SAM protein [Desulfatitalea alkaliphila]MCJ8502001.1 radical SAM protein [Desulfatitalea alkaliphila]